MPNTNPLLFPIKFNEDPSVFSNITLELGSNWPHCKSSGLVVFPSADAPNSAAI